MEIVNYDDTFLSFVLTPGTASCIVEGFPESAEDLDDDVFCSVFPTPATTSCPTGSILGNCCIFSPLPSLLVIKKKICEPSHEH